MAYWLMKSEPTVYSITDLERDGETLWDGVRNYQARNYLRQMAVGDLAFFYHSNSTPPGIVGLMAVAQTQVVDPSQFDPAGRYYDPKSTPEAPRWSTVTITYRATFSEILSLDTLRCEFTPEELAVVRQGNRLSVLPVAPTVAHRILALAGLPPDPGSPQEWQNG